MHEDDGSPATETPEATTGAGERWRLRVLDIVQRWTPERRWLQFAAAIEERHVAAFARSTPKRRDRSQGFARSSERLADIPTPLEFGDLIHLGEPDRMFGGRSVRFDLPERQTQRARRPRTGAEIFAPAAALRTVLPEPRPPQIGGQPDRTRRPRAAGLKRDCLPARCAASRVRSTLMFRATSPGS